MHFQTIARTVGLVVYVDRVNGKRLMVNVKKSVRLPFTLSTLAGYSGTGTIVTIHLPLEISEE